MNNKQVLSTKKEEWLKGGGVEKMEDFLDDMVKEMSDKANQEGLAFKQTDENQVDDSTVADGLNSIVAESDINGKQEDSDEDNSSIEKDDESHDDTPAQEDAVTSEGTDETDITTEGTDETDELVEQENDANRQMFEKAIGDAVSAGIKAYHDQVIAPLLADLAEVKSLTKDVGNNGFNWLGTVDLMPSAAVAERITQEFALNYSTPKHAELDSEATDLEVKEAVTEVNLDNARHENFNGNLLADF